MTEQRAEFVALTQQPGAIRRADRIYVIREGRVARQGTFAELLDEEGMFRDLARRRMS